MTSDVDVNDARGSAYREMFASAEAFYCECGIVRQFIDQTVWPIAEREFNAGPSTERSSYLGLLERVLAWLRSIDRLNKPSDIQAIAAGARSLLETSVDVTLLYLDPAECSHEKIMAWEDSANLALGERLERFCAGQVMTPAAYWPALRWAASRRSDVLQDRARLWPRKDGRTPHPSRWTGRSLEDDVLAADELRGDRYFRFLYDTQFALLCWNTHGSALAGLRPHDKIGIAGLNGMAFGVAADSALNVARMVLLLFGVPETDTGDHFDRINTERQTLREFAQLGLAQVVTP
jgi:hypothetical protein